MNPTPALAALAMLGAPVLAAAAAGDDGFVPLFNGRDLSGWVNINTAPDTWSVSNGAIHCTGTPTGAMRTENRYENFILDLEWRHLRPAGNSGLFIWSSPAPATNTPYCKAIEVQILDHQFLTNHLAAGRTPGWFTTEGDVFAIHGARMTPFAPNDGRMRSFPRENRTRGSPDWNHYRITGSNGVLTLAVNGAVVSGGSNCVWRKGYICLESEGSPVEFRNLRIKELPSTNPVADEIAPLAK